jgi:trimethylamine--corrinoid protein Co-methyltransferase
MFNIQRSIVSSVTVSKIHSLSLRILDEIGIPIQSERAIEILDAAGCKIDRDGSRVFIPKDVVTKALKAAPPHFSLYDRSGTNEITIGNENVSFMSGAAAIRVKDLNGIYRNPTLKDLSDMTRLHANRNGSHPS